MNAVAKLAARAERVLVMCHSHPRLSNGGAEVSAYALFESLRAAGVEAWFLGCSRRASDERLGVGMTQPFGEGEYLYAPGELDDFTFANRDARYPGLLAELLETLRPTVVHCHHYTTLGSETFLIVKRIRPAAKLVLTLHEYYAICNNDGQMVKAGNSRLCDGEAASDCAACFPARSPADFFLRKSYLQSLLGDVDVFVSPSRFLASRYVAWGIPAGKVRVLENIPAAGSIGPGDTPASKTARPLRAGFFGQISTLKGVPLLLRAARRLAELDVKSIVIDIFGDYSNQPAERQVLLAAALEDPGHNVAYRGAYRNAEVVRLMQSVDVVVVPSIWWENSPVVIQEAFRSRRPVVCSDIGGMAEMVRPGLDGLHFRVGDAVSLAQALLRLVDEPGLLEKLGETLAAPTNRAAAVASHRALYRDLRAERHESHDSAIGLRNE